MPPVETDDNRAIFVEFACKTQPRAVHQCRDDRSLYYFCYESCLILEKRCLIHEKSHLVNEKSHLVHDENCHIHEESCLRMSRSAIEILLRENQSEVSLYPMPKQRMPPIKLTMP